MKPAIFRTQGAGTFALLPTLPATIGNCASYSAGGFSSFPVSRFALTRPAAQCHSLTAELYLSGHDITPEPRLKYHWLKIGWQV